MTLTELRARNSSWANKSDAEIAARAKEKGIAIDPEPAAAPPTGNGPSTSSGQANGGTIPPNVAAGTQVLMERNAKPHVWEQFAKDHGLSLDDLVNYARSAATGVAQAVTEDIPGLTAGNQLLNVGIKYATGATPAEHVQRAAAAIGAPFHEDRPGTADPYVRSVSRSLTLAPIGEGAIAPRILGSIGGGLGSEAAGQLAQKYAPGLEGPARFLASVGGGYAGGMATGRPAKPTTPTTQELKSQASQKYTAAEQSGVTVPAQAYDVIAKQVTDRAMMSGADPDLTPKVTTAMKRVTDAQGTDKTVREMEQVRRKINIAAQSLDPSERRIGREMRDEFDLTYQNLAPSEIKTARALTRRYKGGEVLDEIQRQVPIKGAQYSQAGIENAYRERYRQLAMNQRKMRQFDPEGQAAVTRVATGTGPGNFLRGVGKYAPTGVIPFMGSVTAGGGAGYFAGMPEIGAAVTGGLAGAGIAGKMANTALTKRNVRAAEAAVRGEPGALKARQQALEEMRREMLRQALIRAAATTPGLLQ